MSTSSPETRQRAPAPGETASRSEASEKQYRARAHWFTERTARELSIDSPSPLEVAAHALTLKPEWSKSTWRVTKSALLFAWGERRDEAAAAAVAFLSPLGQQGCLRTSKRTSGRRSKSADNEELREVITALRATRSRYEGVTVSWLVLGRLVGIRPHEWCCAEVVRCDPSSVGDLDFAGSPDPLPYLRVENAKATNGRSHGQYRHLNLASMPEKVVTEIERFARLMGQVQGADEYRQYYEGASKLLQRVNAQLHADDSKPWIQLYSARHSFSSNAKKHLTLQEAAAMLGHATTRTGQAHYGKRRHASGSFGAKPVAMEVERVRAMRGYQAEAIARAKRGPGPK